jgi:hypothetical protein
MKYCRTKADAADVPSGFLIICHELINNWLHPDKPNGDGPVEKRRAGPKEEPEVNQTDNLAEATSSHRQQKGY